MRISWIPDGVFVHDAAGALAFVPLPAPTDADVAQLCTKIGDRVMRLFGEADETSDPMVDEEDAVIAAAQAEALHAPCKQRTFFDDTPEPTRSPAPLSAYNAGFSLHAGLSVKGEDRDTLMRLLQYGSRPPFAAKRLSLLKNGTVRLKLRKPFYTGQTELILAPEAFLKRLFAILPPPQFHITRYHGIFSSHAKLRSKLKGLLPTPQPLPSIEVEGDGEADAAATSIPEPLRPTYTMLLSRTFPDGFPTGMPVVPP